jgi:hypothetical protein
MKKSFLLALAGFFLASGAYAAFSTNQVWELNNLFGKAATEMALGTKLQAAEQTVIGANGDLLANSTDDSWIFTSNDEAMVVQVQGFEAKAGTLELCADQCDDTADKFSWSVSTSDVLTFSNGATALWTVSSAGAIAGIGTTTFAGFSQVQTASTTVALTAAQCGTTLVSNSADTMTLPEASTVLGCRYTFVCGTTDDFVVNPADGTDAIGTVVSVTGTNTTTVLAPSAGDSITCTDIGSSITIEAVGANLWASIGAANGTWTDTN